MTTEMKKKIIHEINEIPDNKAGSLLDYILFLKYTADDKIPNQQTIDTFNDTDNKKNLNVCSSAEDMFNQLGI